MEEVEEVEEVEELLPTAACSLTLWGDFPTLTSWFFYQNLTEHQLRTQTK